LPSLVLATWQVMARSAKCSAISERSYGGWPPRSGTGGLLWSWRSWDRWKWWWRRFNSVVVVIIYSRPIPANDASYNNYYFSGDQTQYLLLLWWSNTIFIITLVILQYIALAILFFAIYYSGDPKEVGIFRYFLRILGLIIWASFQNCRRYVF